MLAAIFVLSLLPAPLHRTGGVAVLRAARTPLAASNVVMLEPVERGETGYKRYVVKQFFRKTFTPKKVAAEEQARKQEAALDAALDMVGATLVGARSGVATMQAAAAEPH